MVMDFMKWNAKVADRLTEQQQRLEALETTIKTINGMAQLAVQQVARVRNEAEELKRDAVELVTGVRNKPDMGR